ncbi:TcdA/TcdB pore-forming domain-containing protein [Silvanigrella aquatica]|uniref:TcdA/TcdB toxin pore forming domain-containing protein n=1 Tax=Silvanigrella aquatica TaxID=1915309 RepID=A0A1L4D1H9_9BACT|nr:TcdA/TcdB pore-forming domain-containing protein [Silvanigrella aquatica]APJ04044.1 hypothetical protein AXG55_09045 [Silvanigrella aquatica]
MESKLIHINSLSLSELDNLNDFKIFLDDQSESFYHSTIGGDPYFNISKPSIGLSHAYLIKNIIDYFSKSENNNELITSNETLDEIVKIHIYSNLTQLSLDIIDSVEKSANVVNLLKSNEFQNLNSFKTLTKLSQIIGSTLNIVNVIFDGTELLYAKTNAETAKYGTQLALDGTSLGFMTAGFALEKTAGSIAIAETAGIFLSGLGEIFGGLSVGISFYAELVGSKIDKALKYASYFLDYENNHYKIINSETFYPDTNNTVVSLAQKDFIKNNDKIESKHLDIVIKEIDFTKNNEYKITFGDHLTYPITRHENGKYYYHSFAPNPEFIKNTEERVKIREALQIKSEYTFPINQMKRLILPNQAQNLILYQFTPVPFNIDRNDGEFSAVDKIQNNAKFIFRYTFMHGLGDQAVGKLSFHPNETNISIKLNSKNKDIHFITPEIQESSKNKINYIFDVLPDESKNKNSYHLFLSQWAKYQVNPLETNSWHFHFDNKFDSIEFNNNTLNIIYFESNQRKNHSILFQNKMPEKIYIHDKTGITYLAYHNFIRIEITPVFINRELNAENFRNIDEIKDLLNKYNNIENLLNINNENIKIVNYKKTPTSNKETIFYNVSNDMTLYTGIDSSDLMILGKIGNDYIYSNKDKSKLYLNNNEILKKTKKDIIVDNKKLFIKFTETDAEMNYYYDEFSNLNLEIFCIENSYGCIENTNFINTNKEFLKNISVIRILSRDKQKTDSFYLIKNKEFIVKNDKNAKIIQQFYDKNLNSNYYFISGAKFYIIKVDSNKTTTYKTFNFPDIEKEFINENNFIFSNQEYIYEFTKEFKSSIIGIKEGFLSKNIDRNLKSVLNSIQTENNKISILINDLEFAEFNKINQEIYIQNINRHAIGESHIHNNRYYFYNDKLNKYSYIDKKYINPNNFTIIEENNKIKFKYDQQEIWNDVEKIEENIMIKNMNSNKKMALFLRHFNENNSNNKETCSEISNSVHNLKKTLCDFGHFLNNKRTKLINAYSNVNATTLFLTQDQSSLKQLDSRTNKISNENTEYEYWGVADWLGKNAPYTSEKKLFAFGESTNPFIEQENIHSAHFFSDIRFVDIKGNILKPNSLDDQSSAKNYIIENKLNEKYALSVIGAFILEDNHSKYIYFLKNDFTYDILNTHYQLLKSDYMNNLFLNIPESHLKNVDYIIKLKENIILFVKNPLTKNYESYYIVPVNYLFQKSYISEISYVNLES